MSGARPHPTDGGECYDAIIVGAGIAGLMAASEMVRKGLCVIVLEKSRGVGGRMATRRWEGGAFDHGAQFFTARDARFREFVHRWGRSEAVTEWYRYGTAEEIHYRGAPTMTAVPKRLAEDLNVRLKTRVANLAHGDRRVWNVTTEDGEVLRSRSLLLTAPVPQSLSLLDAAEGVRLNPVAERRLRAVRYRRCLAFLLRLDRPASIDGYNGALKVEHPRLQWIGDNQAKGLCPATPAVTVHSSGGFADAHWDSPDAVRAPLLLEAVKPYVHAEVVGWQIHRWRYAQPLGSFGEDAYFDPASGLALAGDGLVGGRVEGAAVSGLAAARKIVSEFHRSSGT